MSSFVNIQAQLTSIMDILARSAVAEIGKLVDESATVLHLEICRSKNENEALKRKLQLMEMELRIVRNSSVGACESSIFHPTVRVRDGDSDVFLGTDFGKLRKRRRSPQTECSFGKERITNTRRNGEPTALDEENSTQRSLVWDESTKMEELDRPTLVLIKKEYVEEDTGPEEGLKICAEGIIAGENTDAEGRSPCEEEEEEETRRSPAECLEEGAELEIVVKAERGKELKPQMLVRSPSPHSSGGFPPQGTVCMLYESDAHLGASFVQGESDTDSTEYSQSLSDRVEFLPASSALDDLSNVLSSASSTDVEPQFSSPVTTAAGKEEVKIRSECSEDTGLHMAQTQREKYMEMRWNLPSQPVEPVPDARNGDGGGYSMAMKMKSLKRACKGEKRFSCVQCGNSFTTRFYLKIHQRIHTGERPFTCTQCGKSFYCTSHLISHQRSHTGEKPYSCDECGNSYSHLNSLKLHHRVHTYQYLYE